MIIGASNIMTAGITTACAIKFGDVYDVPLIFVWVPKTLVSDFHSCC